MMIGNDRINTELISALHRSDVSNSTINRDHELGLTFSNFFHGYNIDSETLLEPVWNIIFKILKTNLFKKIIQNNSTGDSIGILDVIFPNPFLSFSDENIILIGKQYKNRSEFLRKSKIYKEAEKRNLLDVIFPPLKQTRISFKKTPEYIITEGKKFNSRSEFAKKSYRTYERARKTNLLDVIFPKITPPRRTGGVSS